LGALPELVVAPQPANPAMLATSSPSTSSHARDGGRRHPARLCARNPLIVYDLCAISPP
jgi:hypothetical protein